MDMLQEQLAKKVARRNHQLAQLIPAVQRSIATLKNVSSINEEYQRLQEEIYKLSKGDGSGPQTDILIDAASRNKHQLDQTESFESLENVKALLMPTNEEEKAKEGRNPIEEIDYLRQNLAKTSVRVVKLQSILQKNVQALEKAYSLEKVNEAMQKRLEQFHSKNCNFKQAECKY